jgi:plasmid stabilization system protein ParE
VALRYVIKARARREIESAAAWWAENRPAAPGAVRIEITDALAILVLQPGIGERIETGRPVQVRRFRTDKTHRWIYYRVKGGVLEVLSVWGTDRGSNPKL